MNRAVVIALIVALAGCPRSPPKPARPKPLPAEAYARYLAGRVAVYQGAYDRAVTELRAAAAAAPDEAMIVVALIDAIYRTGDRKAARQAVLDAEERWPKQPAVWLMAGQVHRGLGDHEAARRSFEHAIRLGRGNEPAWLGLASSWIALDKPDRAERAYRDLLEAVPDSVDGRFLLAGMLIERDADAEAELRKVIELDPDHVDARLALARALRRRGELATAVLETRQAYDRTGGDLTIAEELFWLLCESDDRTAALDLLGLLDDPAATLATRLGIAQLYGGLGALDDAVRVADAARQAFPESTGAVLAAAQARADRARGSDRADALAFALAVPIADDNAPTARALAAELRIADGDVAGALELVQAARAERPDAIDLMAAEASVLRTGGDPAAGRKLLEAAVTAKPGSVARRFALASFERAAGDPARAAAIAEKIVAARKDHLAALNLAGYALAEAGTDLDRARDYLARARELAPGDASVLDSWGWLLFKRGELADAEAALARAARLAPHLAEIQSHLDAVRKASGK